MRRHRRLVVSERVIPFLAAFVGLLALAGAVIVDLDGNQRAEQMSQELARLQLSLEQLAQRLESAATPADDGLAEGLLALQDRMNTLEQEWARRPPLAASPGAVREVPAAAAIDPSLPTTDCIPAGTRFMAMNGESYPICQSPVVVRVEAVTGDSVVVDGTGTIAETTSAVLAGSDCTLMVFSAEIEGFAEMRVNCP
ncbi:hypothetical protein [Devosia sp.]|uniref:hypothetical protein n=1 Tax=Devosia sp. TaxID=1871048 RepID=UPI002EF9AC4E